MRRLLTALCLTCVLSSALSALAQADKQLDREVPERARQLVAQAVELAARDRLDQAIASLKEAIAIAPNYVNAHAQYIWVKANFLGRYDEVRAEYETLMSKEPRNPVYPMAFAIGQGQTQNSQPFYEKVVELSPQSTWANYARAWLASEKEPETAVAELQKYIEKDGSWLAAYNIAIYIQEKRLNRIDDAITTAEKMALHPEFHAKGLSTLWRLRLNKAQGSFKAIPRAYSLTVRGMSGTGT
jgi:tetratricopeptide (TPR) repeat protein